MTTIADKLQKIAEQTPKVYQAGYDAAMADGELAPQVPFFLSAFDATPWRAKYTASEGVFAEGGVVFNRFRGTMTSGQDGIMVSTIMPENGSNNDLAKNILGRYLIFRIRTNYSISGSTLRHFIQIQGDDSCEEGRYHAASVDIAPLKNGNWATYVIDITEACSRYVKDDGGYYPSIMHAGLTWYLRGVDHTTKYIDIAYSAVCETEDELLMLMRKETKFYHYDNSTNTWTQRSVADIINKTTHNCDYNDGFTAGKQAEYDAFWDACVPNGVITINQCLCAGRMWNDDTFYPTFDIICAAGRADYMFFYNGVTNLKQRLIDCGVRLDTSKVTVFTNIFAYSNTEVLPEISTMGAANLNTLFSSASKLKTVDKLILKSDGSQAFNNTFNGCSSLENITIEGVIGKNIDFSDCTKLTRESIDSIVNALADENPNGATLTLSLEATNTAFNTDDLSMCGEWYELTRDKHWGFTFI